MVRIPAEKLKAINEFIDKYVINEKANKAVKKIIYQRMSKDVKDIWET